MLPSLFNDRTEASNSFEQMNGTDITCVHRINVTPIDPSDAIFAEYSAFKLGVTRSVRHFAELLLPLVQGLIASDAEHTDWVLTAPAIAAQTPAAANLLCWELFRLCQRERDLRARKLTLIDIQHDSESTASVDWKDPTKSQDYAKLDYADRVTEREKFSQWLARNAEFHGRPVLFVNDICVTGAQQHTMQQYFERAEAACVRWLYVIAVDQEVGRSNPEIEWQINFVLFEDLLRMVSREEIQFTSKCVQRLMNLSMAELDQVLRALNAERRKRLLELAVLNGFQNLGGFQDQMKLVRSYDAEGIPAGDD
ncbi:MAG TPA: phosphoribosyltransferase family protein [Pyrinomonadaceae bacterium]|nr:phosphoribosyltransferase family protein [Pyrinomonadaceae bacterium]